MNREKDNFQCQKCGGLAGHGAISCQDCSTGKNDFVREAPRNEYPQSKKQMQLRIDLLRRQLDKAEAVINLYANGCNGSLYFINDQKEAEYRKPARDYFYA